MAHGVGAICRPFRTGRRLHSALALPPDRTSEARVEGCLIEVTVDGGNYAEVWVDCGATEEGSQSNASNLAYARRNCKK
jgi:hypothetical protein